MSEIMDVWRAFMCWLFRTRYVVLIDNDGEEHIRRVIFRGGQAGAWRYGFGVRFITLLDGGETRGACYVKSWRPYELGAARRWPSPAS